MLEIKNWYDCSKCGKALDDGEFEKIEGEIVCFKCMVKKLKDEIARLKEKHEKLKLSPNKNLTNSVREKIVNTQTTYLDLENNAKELNLDLISYIELLESYFDEIEICKPSIYNKDSKTIDMLIDAGQLLSVDKLTNKLSKLRNSTNDKSESIDNEIEIYRSSLILLKKKLFEMNDISNEFLSIALTNNKDLLNRIRAKKVHINIEQISEELCLPENLIVEFIKDVYFQLKEYLPILIKAYKNKDTKKLYNTARMLRGATRNLKLIQIDDTLFKIQYIKDLNIIALYIKNLVAYIKGLNIEFDINKTRIILVATKNLLSEKLLYEVITSIGYECDILNDETEIINKLNSGKYNIIFIDETYLNNAIINIIKSKNIHIVLTYEVKDKKKIENIDFTVIKSLTDKRIIENIIKTQI